MEYGIFITERMQPMASKSKSIIGGMTVLGIAGIICKLVGVLFSIPLTYVIGAQGQGIYNAVFPTYNLLLTISSAGLPVAVSRMVSSALAKDDPHSAKHVFRVALLLLTTLGCLAAIIMLAGSGMWFIYKIFSILPVVPLTQYHNISIGIPAGRILQLLIYLRI